MTEAQHSTANTMGREMGSVLTGLDCVLRDGLKLPGRGRCGLLCNASTVSREWVPTAEALPSVPGLRLERIFAPQHGFAAEKQDNMVESADGVHPLLGIPIVSLYGARREPDPGALGDLDALIIDLQDVGTRVYTFLVTAVLCLRQAAAVGVPVVVLDRPNPIGGRFEGPVLEESFQSFVGILDLPLRHGLTPAELLQYAAARLDLPGQGKDFLRVVPLEGWDRSQFFDQTGQPWVLPSPNMPTLDTALVYPGQVALEGTNLSEGRGTTRPFELFGASYLDPGEIRRRLHEAGYIESPSGSVSVACSKGPLAGARLREIAYEPSFHKDCGETVRGFQIHVTERTAYRPVGATLALLWAIRGVHPDEFAWREPPYEYELERAPIDLIFGSDRVRLSLESRKRVEEIAGAWTDPLKRYQERITPYLLYS